MKAIALVTQAIVRSYRERTQVHGEIHGRLENEYEIASATEERHGKREERRRLTPTEHTQPSLKS